MHDVSGLPESDSFRELIAPENEPSIFLEEQPGYAGPSHEAFVRSRQMHKSPYNHEHLPVFRAYIALNEYFDKDVALDSVPRSFRYALVDKLREDLVQLEVLIYMLYDTEDLDEKMIFFRQARICCLDIRGRFRSLYRRKLLNDGRFIRYADLLDKVATEVKQWQNATRKRKDGQGK